MSKKIYESETISRFSSFAYLVFFSTLSTSLLREGRIKYVHFYSYYKLQNKSAMFSDSSIINKIMIYSSSLLWFISPRCDNYQWQTVQLKRSSVIARYERGISLGSRWRLSKQSGVALPAAALCLCLFTARLASKQHQTAQAVCRKM